MTLRRWEHPERRQLQTTIVRSNPPFVQQTSTRSLDSLRRRDAAADWDNAKQYDYVLLDNGRTAGFFAFGPPLEGQTGLSIFWWMLFWTTARRHTSEFKAVELLTRAAFEIGAEKVQICRTISTESPDVPIRLGYRLLTDTDSPPLVGESTPPHSIWQMDSLDQLRPIVSRRIRDAFSGNGNGNGSVLLRG